MGNEAADGLAIFWSVTIGGTLATGGSFLQWAVTTLLEDALGIPLINSPDDLAKYEARQGEKNSVGAMRRLEYEPAPYHGTKDRFFKSKGPSNGQNALDVSLQVKSTSSRRIGIDYNSKEFVIFDETGKGSGIYHGHVRTWEDLTQEMRNTLTEAKMADKNGKILGDE